MFDPERPGSITHFYQAMSFGKLYIDGVVAPKYYESEHEASWYLSDDPTKVGNFGAFTLDILEQADVDLAGLRQTGRRPAGDGLGRHRGLGPPATWPLRRCSCSKSRRGCPRQRDRSRKTPMCS